MGAPPSAGTVPRLSMCSSSSASPPAVATRLLPFSTPAMEQPDGFATLLPVGMSCLQAACSFPHLGCVKRARVLLLAAKCCFEQHADDHGCYVGAGINLQRGR